MNIQRGLVSVIIPVFNRPKLLREAVASVMGQTYRPFEILIVDDGSTDPDMPAALQACCESGGGAVHALRQPNRGPGAARQHGLDHARGEFIQFLDSDDLLLPCKFAAQVAALAREPRAGVSYGKTRYVLASGEVIAPWRRTGEAIDAMFPSMLAQRWWGTSTPLYRHELLRKVGPITDLVNEEDWEYDCRIAAHGTKLARVDEWVSEQRTLATNRASHQGSSDPAKLGDRASARHRILDSALQAQVPVDAPEFQHFIKYSFLLARQCAALGLAEEAEKLVRRLQEVSPSSTKGLYLLAGKVLGFRAATTITEAAHRTLRGTPSISIA